ncbi:MAG: hypothetical protein EXS14_07450 [Planctomycetes bacterium]|nr:hypothetical protein [Planctomycetota bacterium]
MLTDTKWNALRRLLDITQELAELHVDDSTARRKRLRRGALLRQLRARITRPALRQLPAPLARLATRTTLTPTDLMILAVLLERRIAATEPSMSGRELLQMLGASSAELLTLETTLCRGAPLLRAALISANGDGLDGRFRVHEHLFAQLRKSCSTRVQRGSVGPFKDAVDHLLALREWGLLHELRAALVFPWSCWRDVHPEPVIDAELLQHSIERVRTRILLRESKTPVARLPWLVFRKEHALAPLGDEELLLATLATHAVFTALPPFGLGDLVRLASADAREVLLKRPVLEPAGLLRSRLLVDVEVDTDPMDPQAPVLLGKSARELLLPAPDAGPASTKERQRFHAYLAQLKDSGDFYRRL